MSFEVDNDALKTAMMRHYEEKLAKELREMFVFSQNPDTARIWQLYVEEMERKKKNGSVKTMDGGDMFLIIIVVCIVGHILYRLIAL